MATHGATHRPTSMTTPASMTDHHQSDEKKDSTGKPQCNYKPICLFNIPPSPELAALRIIRNLSHLRLYYILLVWVTLAMILVPQRRESLVFLVVMSIVAYLYALIGYLLPTNLVVPYKTIGTRIVFALLAIATIVGLIIDAAAMHLVVSFGITLPIILVHSVLSRVGDDHVATEEGSATGETALFVYKNNIADYAKAVDLV